MKIWLVGSSGFTARKSLVGWDFPTIRNQEIGNSPQSIQDLETVVDGGYANGLPASNAAIGQFSSINNLYTSEMASVFSGNKTVAQEASTLKTKLDALLQQNFAQYGSGQ